MGLSQSTYQIVSQKENDILNVDDKTNTCKSQSSQSLQWSLKDITCKFDTSTLKSIPGFNQPSHVYVKSSILENSTYHSRFNCHGAKIKVSITDTYKRDIKWCSTCQPIPSMKQGYWTNTVESLRFQTVEIFGDFLDLPDVKFTIEWIDNDKEIQEKKVVFIAHSSRWATIDLPKEYLETTNDIKITGFCERCSLGCVTLKQNIKSV